MQTLCRQTYKVLCRTGPLTSRDTDGSGGGGGSDGSSAPGLRSHSAVPPRTGPSSPRCSSDQRHLLGQPHVSDPQRLVLVLADVLLHLLDLGGAQLVAPGRVLVVLGKLPGHLLPAVRRSF